MAKNQDLISSFQEFKEFKNIDRETLMRILEEVFRSALAKHFGSEDNFDIIVNIDKGDLEIFRNRMIVEDGAVQDPTREIAISDALKIEDDFEVGEELSEPILMTEFGRREILSIRQNLVGKIQDYEKSLIFQKYKEKVGEIIVGEVYQPWNKEVLVLDDEKIELILPKAEQIPSDRFRKGDTGSRRGAEGGDEEQQSRNHPQPHYTHIPGAPARSRGARDIRRPHHHQEHRAPAW